MEASGDGGTVFVGTELDDVADEPGGLIPGGSPPDCGVPGPGGVVKLKEGDGKDDRIEDDGEGVAESIGLGQACATLADEWDEGVDVGLEL